MSVVLSLFLTASVASMTPVSLKEVLDSLEDTHPDLEKAAQGIKKAEGKKRAATGVFDPQVSVQGQSAPVGFYQTERVDAVVRQFTPLLGASVFAGYRLGTGNFPVYKGDLETLSEGELRAGIEVPLWKDGPIDARRAELQKTRLRARASECDFEDTFLKVSLAATQAYWKWVAAGQELRIQRELLSVAEERDLGLRTQAQEGKLADIVVVDNERLVLDRRAKLLDAQRDLNAATLGLSLYFRDERKSPIVLKESSLPSALPPIDARVLPKEEDDVTRALKGRPELCRWALELAEARVDVDWAENQRAPGIHASAFAARDMGLGPERLAPAEVGLGLRVEMPLLLTKARGDLAAARADVLGVEAQRRNAQDAISAQVRQARVEVGIAREQATLATRQVDAAQRLADAERLRFEEGASELVVVNLRELAAAESQRLEVKALEAYQRAWAEYVTSLGERVSP